MNGERFCKNAMYLRGALSAQEGGPIGRSVLRNGEIRPDAPKILIEEAEGIFSGVGYFAGADDEGVHLEGYDVVFRFPVNLMMIPGTEREITV